MKKASKATIKQTQKVYRLSQKESPLNGSGQGQEKEGRCSEKVYKIMNKVTGKVGGNGNGDPIIYGELTIGIMQKVANCLIKHTDSASIAD